MFESKDRRLQTPTDSASRSDSSSVSERGGRCKQGKSRDCYTPSHHCISLARIRIGRGEQSVRGRPVRDRTLRNAAPWWSCVGTHGADRAVAFSARKPSASDYQERPRHTVDQLSRLTF